MTTAAWKGSRFGVRVGMAAALLAMLAASARAQGYTDVRELGTGNRFCGFYVASSRELTSFLTQYRGDIDAVLLDARLETNTEQLLTAVRNGGARPVRVPVGTQLVWMTVRKAGQPARVERVRWAGAEPFEAFEIPVTSGCTEQVFIVPKSCGNVSLGSVRVAPPPGPPNLGVRQSGRCVGAAVTAELVPSGANDDIELSLTLPSGSTERVAAEPTEGRVRWNARLLDPGTYRLSATARNACGVSEPSLQEIHLVPCVPTCEMRLVPQRAEASGRSNLLVEVLANAVESDIALASVAIYRDGERIDGLEMRDGPYRRQWVVPGAGSYRFVGEVRDEQGMTSVGDCSSMFAMPATQRPGVSPLLSVFGGVERRWRPVEAGSVREIADQSAPLVGATAGAVFPLSRGLGLFTQFGGVLNLHERESSSLFADGGIDYFFESGGFVGVGVGYWDFNHASTRDVTLLIHGGIDTPWKLGSLQVQWFAEGRLFADMLDMIDDNYVGVTGIRFVGRRQRP